MIRIFLFLIIAIQISCTNSISKPGLKIKNNQQDLDTITFGNTHLLSYTLLNNGNADLVIDTATSSCGCTEPKLEKKILNPGDSTHLIVYFNPVDTGAFEKAIVIKSNIDSSFSIISFRGSAY